jgi:PD-(D/E)XK nuclease superfamily
MAIVYKEESYRIMGACFEVYKVMGCGFVEPVYQVHNYLKATGFRLGLLVNFGHYPKVEYERIVI